MADSTKFKIALVQLAVGADKAANLKNAVQAVREASGKGANLVALPVCQPFTDSTYPCTKSILIVLRPGMLQLSIWM